MGCCSQEAGIIPLVSVTNISGLDLEPKDPREVGLVPVYLLVISFMPSSLLFPYILGNICIWQGSGGVCRNSFLFNSCSVYYLEWSRYILVSGYSAKKG